MPRRALLCAFLLSSCGLSGCLFWHKKAKLTPGAPRPISVGTVTLVNEESKFVLVDNGALPTPPVGGVLKCYPANAADPSAELVATDVRKRPFTIADIREGMPHKGDRVLYLPPEMLGGKPKLEHGAAAAPPASPAPVQPSTAGPGFQ